MNAFGFKKIVSEKWSLVKEDWLKIAKGFKIALGGAIVAGLIVFFSQLPGTIDVTQYGNLAPYITLVLGAICAGVLNILNKWATKTEYTAQ